MDMAKRVAFGTREWAEYAEYRIRNGLSIEEGFTLAMLEMEVPFARLGFETFSEFLEANIPQLEHLLKDSDLSRERSLIPIESTGDLKVGSRVIWFGKDSTTFKGTVNWLGSIERILCAGVFSDEKIGSPFPILWRGKRLFFTPSGHSIVLRVNELILKSDYAQRQTSMLSRALTKLMRKVSIRERPRERNSPDDFVEGDPNKIRQFDIIYPFAVASGPSGLKVNDTIIWANNAGSFKGRVKWLGHLNCKSGLTVGIDFKKDIGNTSGSYGGHKLFDCKPNQGKFLCIECIRKSEIQNIPIQSSALISTHTFEFSNQDLCLQWHRNRNLPRHFQLGDIVLYQRDSNSYLTGTLEWLGTKAETEVAGIRFDAPIRSRVRLHIEPLPFECPSERGDLVLLEKVVPYTRVTSVEDRTGSSPVTVQRSPSQIQALKARVTHEWFPQKGIITPCISPERLNRLIGYKRGIQGHMNSSHMASVLFAIFSCSDTFDSILLHTDENDDVALQILKEILRTEIANRIRRRFFCLPSNVQAVAQIFSKGEQMTLPGNPDKVLEVLLENVNPNTKDAFLHYKDGTVNSVHRIMATTSNISENIVTIQHLLETDMKLKSLQFQKDPTPALVVILPERNEDLAPSKIFIPNFVLELTSLMVAGGESSTNSLPPEASSPCTLCGEVSSTECPDCELLVSKSTSNTSSSSKFCTECSEVFHQHWTRRSHRTVPRGGASGKGKSLELQSIICTRDNQSIAFVKCGTGKNGEWIVHDSMPDGSSPQVQNVFSLTDCLLSLENEPASVLREWDSFIPEVKIILSFAHMCIYSSVESLRNVT